MYIYLYLVCNTWIVTVCETMKLKQISIIGFFSSVFFSLVSAAAAARKQASNILLFSYNFHIEMGMLSFTRE